MELFFTLKALYCRDKERLQHYLFSVICTALGSNVILETLANILHALLEIIGVSYFNELVQNAVDSKVERDANEIHDVRLRVGEHRVVEIMLRVACVDEA